MRTFRRSAFRADQRRPGYTLLELMISIVLLTTLMSAVWGLLSMYNSLLTAGQEQSQEQQLVRSVFQLLSEDLASVALPNGTIDRSSADDDTFFSIPQPLNTGHDSGAESTFADALLFEEPREIPSTLSFMGTSFAIRMTICRPQPPADSANLSEIDLLNALGGGSLATGDDSMDGRGPNVPEFQTIVYQAESISQLSSPTTLPAGLYRIQASAATLSALQSQRSTAEQNLTSENEVAVTRPTLEALLFPQNGELDVEFPHDGPLEGGPMVERMPEVVGCRFEYFDDGIWLTKWRSDRSGELPAAIRISLDVATLPDALFLEQSTVGPDVGADSLLERRLRPPFARPIAAPARTEASDGPQAMPSVEARTYRRIILLDSTRAVPSPETRLSGEPF